MRELIRKITMGNRKNCNGSAFPIHSSSMAASLHLRGETLSPPNSNELSLLGVSSSFKL